MNDTELEIQLLAKMIRESTAAQGLDRYVTEVVGLDASEWSEMTGRHRSTISRNARRASENN